VALSWLADKFNILLAHFGLELSIMGDIFQL
jgi:hypothetical protein